MSIVAFDVDGTLFDHEGYPNFPVIDLLRAMQGVGCRIVVWSGGGMSYAEAKAKSLGLKDVLIWDKNRVGGAVPDIAVDDMEDCKLGLSQIIIRDLR